MEQPFFFQIFLLLNLIPILPLTFSETTLDPKQLEALKSLNLPMSTDPCSIPRPLQKMTLCDNSSPFRHLISLHLENCPEDTAVSYTALKSLSSLEDLSFLNCPATVAADHFPVDLASNLRSFTCTNSLRKVDGNMLSQLQNVINLTITSVPIIIYSGPSFIFNNLNQVTQLTISHANLNGLLPKTWPIKLAHIDLSYNQLKGNIPSSITELENLISLDLTGNQLTGQLPASIGDLIGLKNFSVSSNTLSGSIPESMASMPELEYIDLSSNRFNGTIPKFLNKLKGLKYLNLENNSFKGILPFNETFIKKLDFFKIGHNLNLCYNNASISFKVKLGIAPCDQFGLPIIPPEKTVPSDNNKDEDEEEEDQDNDEDDRSDDETRKRSSKHHGPNKVVLGFAIAISSMVFLIIFLIFLARKWA